MSSTQTQALALPVTEAIVYLLEDTAALVYDFRETTRVRQTNRSLGLAVGVQMPACSARVKRKRLVQFRMKNDF